MRKAKNGVLFCAGGGLYVLLELLWRGRSHVSMFCLGGACFLMLGKLRKIRLPLSVRICLGALGVTAGELVTGLLVNQDYTVWDYRGMPLNFRGQICLPYALLWIPVSLMGMLLYGGLERRLCR